MKKDMNISIAAGEALLFLENSVETVSIERLEKFIKFTRVNINLILGLLISEKMISIAKNEKGVTVIQLSRNSSYA